MATTTAADILVETLLDWGVDTIFGMPGDGINGIFEALRIRKEKIRLSKCGTKNPQPSWRALMRNSRESLGYASPHRDPAASIS